MDGTPQADPKVTRVVAAAAAEGLDIQPVRFPEHTRTAEDAARAVGCDVGQIVKSLVFEAGGEPVLLLVSGANRVDTERAAQAAGLGPLTKADAERARAASGYSIGATPPFGHATDIPVFIDEDLFAFDEVWAAAGRPDSVFPAPPSEIARVAKARPIGLRQD